MEIVKDLSNNNFIVVSLQQALLNVFLSILTNPRCVRLDEYDAQCLSIRVVNFLVIHSPKHLVQELVQQGFPVVFKTINGSKDPKLIEVYHISCKFI